MGFDGRGNVICSGVPRPSMRIISAPRREKYPYPVKHDDVVVVPEFFCAEDDWDIYYQLVKEMRESQAAGDKKADCIPWHEGAHLLSQNPTGSRTYQRVLDQMADYFSIAQQNRGTRFNWYRDGSDWNPFHHDSAAFNPQRPVHWIWRRPRQSRWQRWGTWLWWKRAFSPASTARFR